MTSRDGFTIVWDWNGTLCDDRTILLDAVGQTLVNEGFEPLSQQQLIQRFARPLRTFFENACGRDLLTSEWERVQSTFRRIYRSRGPKPPTVATKYEFVHNVGSRDRNHANSSRTTRNRRPLIGVGPMIGWRLIRRCRILVCPPRRGGAGVEHLFASDEGTAPARGGCATRM